MRAAVTPCPGAGNLARWVACRRFAGIKNPFGPTLPHAKRDTTHGSIRRHPKNPLRRAQDQKSAGLSSLQRRGTGRRPDDAGTPPLFGRLLAHHARHRQRSVRAGNDDPALGVGTRHGRKRDQPGRRGVRVHRKTRRAVLLLSRSRRGPRRQNAARKQSTTSTRSSRN